MSKFRKTHGKVGIEPFFAQELERGVSRRRRDCYGDPEGGDLFECESYGIHVDTLRGRSVAGFGSIV